MGSDETATSILAVDDNPENLRLLSSMLGGYGFDLRLVTSGRQALAATESDPPDLVLLDINMPEMNGYEVCEHLKALPAAADVPVIFLTALGDAADKVEAFKVGGVDYITKPFQIEEVVARVNTHLGLRRARQRLSCSLERLEGLERLRDELVHMVVHDMRSPLMVLMAHLEFLKTDVPGLSDESAEDLRTAIMASKMLNHMANDLLDVSRLESGKLPLDRSTCDLSALARSVAADLSALDRARAIDLEALEPVQVSCDAGLVRRVLANIVNNAIKHTPSGGRIVLLASSHAGGARVAVRDSGPGVPMEARERIFEKFGTVAARAALEYHSAGLGLAFCKLAVEAHGGRIGVDAPPEGGSEFWFELPA
jgi:signal transduction histidine kinase